MFACGRFCKARTLKRPVSPFGRFNEHLAIVARIIDVAGFTEREFPARACFIYTRHLTGRKVSASRRRARLLAVVSGIGIYLVGAEDRIEGFSYVYVRWEAAEWKVCGCIGKSSTEKVNNDL